MKWSDTFLTWHQKGLRSNRCGVYEGRMAALIKCHKKQETLYQFLMKNIRFRFDRVPGSLTSSSPANEHVIISESPKLERV